MSSPDPSDRKVDKTVSKQSPQTPSSTQANNATYSKAIAAKKQIAAANAQISELQRPAPLESALKEADSARRVDDCMSCRTIGSMAFLGLAGYVYISGYNRLLRDRPKAEALLRKNGAKVGVNTRMFGIVVLSLNLAGVGVYRMFN